MIGNQEVILLSRSEKHTIFVGARYGTDRNVKVSLVRATEVERGTRKFKLASAAAKRLLVCRLKPHSMVMHSR